MREEVQMTKEDLTYRLEMLEKECAMLHKEVCSARSDNDMLKDVIVHLAMKLTGVTM